MKKIILLGLLALCIQFTLAANECNRFEIERNIPCQLFTTYAIEDPCNTQAVSIYDETGTLLHTATMDIIGSSGRCNVSFNYTSPGQYHANATTGDTWDVTMEEDTMLEIYRVIVYGGYLLSIFVLIFFMHKFKEDKGTPVVYGVIAAALSFIMVAIILSGFDIILGVTFIIDVNYYLIGLTTGIGFYTGISSFLFYRTGQEEDQTSGAE